MIITTEYEQPHSSGDLCITVTGRYSQPGVVNSYITTRLRSINRDDIEKYLTAIAKLTYGLVIDSAGNRHICHNTRARIHDGNPTRPTLEEVKELFEGASQDGYQLIGLGHIECIVNNSDDAESNGHYSITLGDVVLATLTRTTDGPNHNFLPPSFKYAIMEPEKEEPDSTSEYNEVVKRIAVHCALRLADQE